MSSSTEATLRSRQQLDPAGALRGRGIFTDRQQPSRARNKTVCDRAQGLAVQRYSQQRHGQRSVYSLVETAKVNGQEPYTWLRYVLERLALLPWNCSPEMPRQIKVPSWGRWGLWIGYPKTWIGSEGVNVLHVLCDLLDPVQEMNTQLAAHTHLPGPTPSPTDAMVFTAKAGKATLGASLKLITL